MDFDFITVNENLVSKFPGHVSKEGKFGLWSPN